MQMRGRRNTLRSDKVEQQNGTLEDKGNTNSEESVGRKADHPCARDRVIHKTTMLQWSGVVALDTLVDEEIVRQVTRSLLKEFENRLLMGEAIALPCGTLEPFQPNRMIHNVCTGKLQPQGVTVHIRTTQRWRILYKRCLKKFGYK